MKTESFAWVVVAVAVLCIVGFWMFGGNGGSVEDTSVTVVPTNKGDGEVSLPTKPKPSTSSGTSGATSKPTVSPVAVTKPQVSGVLSINELLNLANVSYTCSFTVASPLRSGKFDLAGRKWRGDFLNEVSMINDGVSIYVWTKGASEGLKVAAASGVAAEAIKRQGAIDAFTPLSYKCNISTPDPSRFVPPELIYKDSAGYSY